MKQKILVLTSTFPRWKNDTLPPFVFELSRRLTKYFDITVLAPHYQGAKHQEMMDGLDVRRFSYLPDRWEKLAVEGGIMPNLHNNPLLYLTIPFFFIAEIIATIRLIRKLKPKLIHAHWIIPQGLVAYVVNLLYKTPYVVTVLGGDIYGLQNPFYQNLKKLILQHAKSITVLSHDIKKVILTNIDKNLRLNIVPLGVDAKLFNPNKYEFKLKKQYGISGPFLLFVGRLAEKKGVRYLIKAMPAILHVFPKTKLLIIGTGPLEKNLKELTYKLNLERSITFTGAIKNADLPKYFATADIFIGPSIKTREGDTEGLGVTFIEAAMSGCKIIATKTGGINDIIESKYLIKPQNSQSISSKVIELMGKKKITVDPKIIAKFDHEIVTKEYFLILKNSLK